MPLTVLLPRIGGLGVNGVFWAEPISNLVGGCASFFTMLLTILPELKDEKNQKNRNRTEYRCTEKTAGKEVISAYKQNLFTGRQFL